MTKEENIRAILESIFQGFKGELIDIATKNICNLKQEPKIVRIENGTDGTPYKLFISNGREYEQESKTDVLDEIRAEIEDRMEAEIGDYRCERNRARRECLDIIEKYRWRRMDV